MIECLIIGDSIAVGVAQFRNECVQHAQVGISSSGWRKKFADKDLTATSAIISLGSNDSPAVRTIWELEQIRSNTHASHVYWIVPAINPDVQSMVRTVAAARGDTIVNIPSVSRDGVHPTVAGYKQLAERTKN